jgi:hypothetical protein
MGEERDESHPNRSTPHQVAVLRSTLQRGVNRAVIFTAFSSSNHGSSKQIKYRMFASSRFPGRNSQRKDLS